LFTHICLCSPSSVNWYWRKDGGAPTLHHVGLVLHWLTQWYFHLQAQWPKKGDEMSMSRRDDTPQEMTPYAPVEYGTFSFCQFHLVMCGLHNFIVVEDNNNSSNNNNNYTMCVCV